MAIPPCAGSFFLLPSQKTINRRVEIPTAAYTSILFQEYPIGTKIPDVTKNTAASTHKTPAI